MIELWIIRHGQTYDNISKTLAKYDGGKLTELGKKQAIQCGERLKNESFDTTYVSDLNRTRETFDGINSVRTDNLKQNMFHTNLLREKWAGDAQGMTYNQFHELSKQDRNFKLNNGECWNDVNKRPTRVTDTLRKSTRHTKIEKLKYKQQIK
ncbi:hypothetical protein PPERSA_07939 [Pseudocohnilembus persalinus]|uniref:Histidine phosphatase superfamily, clade-1 n=1 Tax=Pseudocohnilembus persalinus TaxID=266149 RepID=A0A0V0QB55_PSEPJ|nr:hypothetical protein PPERSA_07939 [Pseudocohnilembus persalinus]|eukprot:KRW99454.1 hypothetical protein PPERSA_07939 [Pseudocohnilembus persalinus]